MIDTRSREVIQSEQYSVLVCDGCSAEAFPSVYEMKSSEWFFLNLVTPTTLGTPGERLDFCKNLCAADYFKERS